MDRGRTRKERPRFSIIIAIMPEQSSSENPDVIRPENMKGADVVLGGGLAGLSAGYHLTRAGRRSVVFEADNVLGGLSRTIRTGDFYYDIGGHRFFTKKEHINTLVKELMGDELETVHRRSKIYMRGKFFNYPLSPANSLFGLGPATVFKALADYGMSRVRGLFSKTDIISLEDWVVLNFGRTMFDIYFKEYSEKVWGIDCDRISQSWVAKRIQGLSLGKAIKNAFFKVAGRELPTLADTFFYPEYGIGRIAERFGEEICNRNQVLTSSGVVRLSHEAGSVTGIRVQNCRDTYPVEGNEYISTIPLNTLVKMMDPAPPAHVMRAADSLGYRDLLTVSVMVDRENVTDQTWVYIPEKKYLFGRLHEPKVWSSSMAPEGKTLVVVEFFCFRDDDIWSRTDEELSRITIEGMEELGFFSRDEVLGTDVLRVSKAYPLFEVGYEEHCRVIYDYLSGFENLHIAGRSGMFQYQNMDHAIESGMEAAESLLNKGTS